MKVVLDTNILLVSISPNSAHYWIFQKFISQEFILCVTTDMSVSKKEGFHIIPTLFNLKSLDSLWFFLFLLDKKKKQKKSRL